MFKNPPRGTGANCLPPMRSEQKEKKGKNHVVAFRKEGLCGAAVGEAWAGPSLGL